MQTHSERSGEGVYLVKERNPWHGACLLLIQRRLMLVFCESLQELCRCNPKHVTGESHPQLPERWSSALWVEDGALITPKSCSQGCYEHWSSKHQHDRCGRCCCAVIDAGIAKNKSNHMMRAVALAHEQWPDLYLRAHTCGTRPAPRFMLWTDPQIIAEGFGQWWGALGAAWWLLPCGAWLVVCLHGKREPTLGVQRRDPGLLCSLPCNPLRV